MVKPLISHLKSVKKNIDRLKEQQATLKERIAFLEKENAEMKAALKEKEDLLLAAQKDIEFLSVSYRLAQSPDYLISTRRRITRLIRTIDNCILMLSKEE